MLFVTACNQESKKNRERPSLFKSGPYPFLQKQLKPDSLKLMYPWSKWNVQNFRPKLAGIAYFENNNGDTLQFIYTSFSEDFLAFGFFKKYAPQKFRENFYIDGEQLVFRNIETVGVLTFTNQGPWNMSKIETFKQSFPVSFDKPSVFDSFPIKNRLKNTEAVYPRFFLGKDYIGDVISVKFPCFYDTAEVFRTWFNPKQRVFRALAKDFIGETERKDNGKLFVFKGFTDFDIPVVLYGYQNGLLGVYGCNDKETAEFYIKKVMSMDALLY
ncbi:MAG: hypothetical protein HQK83_17985 [Fibrobacteria bacterium]|nr:hypothetical protein [Fibrobacteria bacterium]